MQTRCKMKIESLEKNQDGFVLNARPVYDSNPESENGKFFSLTPFGQLQIGTINENAVKDFNVGDEVYVDITKVL